ncbi:hypothetical protein PSPO01_13362 [Paraphaeosphaeria sporulosa]
MKTTSGSGDGDGASVTSRPSRVVRRPLFRPPSSPEDCLTAPTLCSHDCTLMRAWALLYLVLRRSTMDSSRRVCQRRIAASSWPPVFARHALARHASVSNRWAKPRSTLHPIYVLPLPLEDELARDSAFRAKVALWTMCREQKRLSHVQQRRWEQQLFPASKIRVCLQSPLGLRQARQEHRL